MLPVNQKKRYPGFRFFKYSFWFVLIFFLLFWFFLLTYQKFLQYQTRKNTAIKSENGIDSLFSVELGNVEQWILIRGQDRSNPMLLVLHGGPGAPLFPFARDLGWRTGLEKHFVMVYWEQRGTGKSYHASISPQSMTLEQMNTDVLELVRYLREQFQISRIYLLARSWGSLLGMRIVQQKPGWFYAYISIGLMVTPMKSDSISFEHTRNLATLQANAKALTELAKIGYPPYEFQELLLQRKWLSRLAKNQETSTDRLLAGNFFNYLIRLLTTPEYSIWDILEMGSDPYFSLRHLWDEKLYKINLMEDLQEIEVPVFFICGRKDRITPGLLVEDFFQNLDAPRGKYFFWFEKSGHQPEYSEPQKFYDILVNKVIPETYHP
ncbi:MAG: alpha/beta hydrolase [Calditrichia bacterium]|nr:alpha/beta hydrolase [Calditrichia bacterium]